MSKQVIATENAPAAVGAYSQGIIANGFVFTAGQIPLVPGASSLREGGIAAQTRQSLNNVKGVLEAAGSSLDKVVKTTVFLADMADFAAFNAVYAEFFSTNPPARSTVQAGGLPVGALVEIEAVATLD
ncbi:MAG: RidA family protein [Chloroflexi bacterium]|nr:RidA family protein [Chloroflexota bacterium]MCY4247857.1 RidA family protein [Chloroflexota bacterium]